MLPLGIAAAIALFVLSKRLHSEAPEPVPPPPAEAPDETRTTPEIEEPPATVSYPIVATPPALPSDPPLPALADSDAAILAALTRFIDEASCRRFLILSSGIHRVVATVDNLTAGAAPRQLSPMKPIGGRFLTTGAGEAILPSTENSRRYQPALAFMESIDTGKLVALYVQYYPLFQEAYRELGYPERDFNTRLVEVIDHLLATPEVTGPIALTPHAVMFKFADPELEALSAGRKALIRMGSENAQRVKTKLRDLRQQVTQASAQSSSGGSSPAR